MNFYIQKKKSYFYIKRFYMKKCAFILLLFTGFGLQASVNWLHSLEQAQKMALATNKLILVDFFATWCGPCKKMDQESWSDPEVGKLASYFVPLKIDVDLKRTISRKYNIRGMPTLLILDGNGKIVFRQIGYMEKDEVMELLKKYAVQTKYMQKEALNYYSHQNYVTALQLAKKYLDFSLYLKDEPRENFLDLAQQYLKEGKVLLDKKQDNYSIMEQKIYLLELVSDLHAKDYERVMRKIGDVEEVKIHKFNKSLYYYLNYCSEKASNKVSAKKWRSKLASNEVFLKKANLLLGQTSDEL